MTIALGVMCKPPRIGVSKTRLAAQVGPELAARLSAAFLQDVAAGIEETRQRHDIRPYALYRPADAGEELRRLLPASFGFMPQHGADLGAAMRAAILELLARGHEGVILMGADAPTLPPDILAEAVETLQQGGERVVLGPSADGGYTLIGVRADHAPLFTGIPWSTSGVLGLTLTRAADLGLAVHVLPEWYDVDDAASLALLRGELAGHSPRSRHGGPPGWPAEATRRVLGGNGRNPVSGWPGSASPIHQI